MFFPPGKESQGRESCITKPCSLKFWYFVNFYQQSKNLTYFWGGYFCQQIIISKATETKMELLKANGVEKVYAGYMGQSIQEWAK